MSKKKTVRLLKAKQVFTFDHPDGSGQGVMMVEMGGGIYVKADIGWVAFDMKEAPNDTEV